ncbi:MAG TPA: hypothetical protein VGG10_14410 [Rhizomicrobium sp.]|jgi:hypothetical protein
MRWRGIAKWAGIVAAVPLGLLALLGTALAYPEPFFAYHAERGRLAIYSDRPFDAAKAQAVLGDVEARISRSPLDLHRSHRIFISNAAWRRIVFMNIASGAGGVNFYPVTRNVFLRHADIDSDTLYGGSGKPAPPPRTLAYYGAHEIAHSLTGEHLGLAHLYNWALPQWVREGYADYVGLGGRGRVDIAAYYRRYRARDPHFRTNSGFYDRFRMLAAFFLDRKGWTVQQLLDSRLTLDQAQAAMDADMAKNG